MIIREKTRLEGEFVKVVVDLERNIMAAGCDLHMDCAEELLADGSKSADLWGANVYQNPARVEFTSMINIRPATGNRAMEIMIPEIRSKVEDVIRALVDL